MRRHVKNIKKILFEAKYFGLGELIDFYIVCENK